MALYLLLASRKLDAFTVAGGAGLLFSLSLLDGYIAGPGLLPQRPIEPMLYVVFGCFFCVLTAAAMANDLWAPHGYPEKQPYPLSHRLFHMILACWFLLLAAVIYQYGAAIFMGMTKRELADTATSGLLTLFNSFTAIAAITALIQPSLQHKTLGTLILALTVAIGFRSPTALTVVALSLYYGSQANRFSILIKYPVRAPVLIGGAVLAGSALKPIYAHFKAGGVGRVWEFLYTTPPQDIFRRGAEFLGTQYQFNEMVRTGFHTDGGHILRAPLSLIPVPRSLYTTPSSEFNQLFQPILFPDHASGMAYNPFAEFFAGLGLAGISVYIIAFMLSLFLLNYFVARSPTNLLPLVLGIAALITFYSFRNSTAVTFGFIRNMLWPYGSLWLIHASAQISPERTRTMNRNLERRGQAP